MNGVHDLGGMHGMGPVRRESHEPVFHAPWEKTVFGMTIVAFAQGICSVDEFRHAIERMDPVEYLAGSYYEHWLAAVEHSLEVKGVVNRGELEAKMKELADTRPKRAKRSDPEQASFLMRVVTNGGKYTREPGVAPQFKVGESVITRNLNPHGHTRLARYARGKRGTIAHHYGTFVFPDSNAMEGVENPQPVYSVRFAAAELWGADAEANEAVYIDLWESYLQPA